MNPESLKYLDSHEWTSVEEKDGEKYVTLGISAFAVEQLNDLVFLELPAIGKQFAAGEVFGEVESVKAVSDLYAPVAFEVTEINSDLPDDLDTLTTDPWDKGWLVRGKLLDESGLDQLLDYATYQKQCEEESH